MLLPLGLIHCVELIELKKEKMKTREEQEKSKRWVVRKFVLSL